MVEGERQHVCQRDGKIGSVFWGRGRGEGNAS